MKEKYAIYYLSKKFTDSESQYSMLEKTCCALAWAAKRLRQYMLNNITWLISKTIQLNISLKSLLSQGEFPTGKSYCPNTTLSTTLKSP